MKISDQGHRGGSEGQKSCETILKDLIEMQKMLKTAWKNIVPSQSYDFLKIEVYG